MKLSEHVRAIRELIFTAFVNQFTRLGVTAVKQGDFSGLDAIGQSARVKLDTIIASHIEETGSYKGAYEKALDEYTFTLFNRLAALKVMESHRMFPEIITKRVKNGGRSFGHRAWLEQNPTMASEELEGLQSYVREAFDLLGRKIRLYSQESTYDMLPYVLDLNSIITAFNAVEEDKDSGTEIWQSDDIMGWLYESYNLSQKQAFKDSGEKIEFDKVALTSQVYTPRWVVEFLVNNSLGKLYLEMYPDSEIKHQYKIANVPATRVRAPKPLHEIRLIDPATGSANFLLYAFDLFYALYLDQIENYGGEYDEGDISKLIIEHNLYGIDLDDRAIQIAQLGLYIKALRKNSRINIEKFNVISSDFYLPEFDEVADSFSNSLSYFSGSLSKDSNQNQLIKEIWADLRHAYQFGSLIRVEERFNAKFTAIYEKMKAAELDMFAVTEYENLEKFKGQFFLDLHNVVSTYSQNRGNSFLQSKTNDAITFLEILTQKYDIAVANPPYTDSSDFGPELKTFVEENYKKPYAFHSNLYAALIKRCLELTTDDGYFATIHPHTFMFIKTFEGVRGYLLDHSHIDVMVDYGLDRANLFGPGILLDATFYVLSKQPSDKPGIYFNITTNLQEKYKYEVFCKAYDDIINERKNTRVYSLNQSKLKIIKSWPFIYWISDSFREKFSGGGLSNTYEHISVGMQMPGNNERFFRFSWEIVKSDAYSRYSKGGGYNNWYGNDWLVVPTGIISDLSIESRHKQTQVGVTSSRTSTKGTSFRIKERTTFVDNNTINVFVEHDDDAYYLLGILNSKVIHYIFDCLNPTVHVQAGDLQRAPYPIENDGYRKSIVDLSRRCVEIKREIASYEIIEPDYTQSPICADCHNDMRHRVLSFLSYENHLFTQILINEALINAIVFKAYELTPEDIAKVLDKEGEAIGGLPVLAEARTAYLTEVRTTTKFPLDHIVNFIEDLPSLKLTEQDTTSLQEKFEFLYQNNNALEEFCIANRINPINIWYLCQKSFSVPPQRAKGLAIDFLVDLIREILNEDEDGIVPLIRMAGEEILIDRVEKKFEEKGLSSAQFSAFSTILGKEINEYIQKSFFADFSDRLNLFPHLPKTPFIWHITSGPRQGFDAFIIIYKWNRDKLFTLKSVYIEKRETALRNRQSDLFNEKSAQAENEKDLIFQQLKEIEVLKIKIDELLSEGYDPKLDDGVGKNIAPLQKKGIIACEVLNPGQLKKYLNADW